MDKAQEELEAFLRWHDQQQRGGYTIANVLSRQEHFHGEMRRTVGGLVDQIRHLNGRVASAENEIIDLRTGFDEHTSALVAIKRRIRNGPHDEEMDTGVHNLAALQARLAEQEKARDKETRAKEEEQTWWKRSVIMWLVGGLGFIAATTITILLTLAIVGASTPKAMPSAPSTHNKIWPLLIP